MSNRIMMMVMIVLMGAIVAPTLAAAPQITEPVSMNENAVITAPHPGFKSVRGRNNRRWWNGLDESDRADIIETIQLEKRAKRKNKHQRRIVGAFIALLSLLLLVDIPLAHIGIVAAIGMTKVIATPTHHRWVPAKDKNGNIWSSEQFTINDHVAEQIESGDINNLSIMIMACAGSGKTTVLEGIIEICVNAYNEDAKFILSIGLIAFNNVIVDLLNAVIARVAPDGADYEARTLSSHGNRTLNHWFKENGNTGTMKTRYSDITRNVILSAMGDDETLKADWWANMPRFDNGDRKEATGWFQICRVFNDTVVKAMGYGAGIKDSGFVWGDFIQAQHFAIGLHEAPMARDGALSQAWETLTMRAIDTAMNCLVEPSQDLLCHDDAPVWLWDERHPDDQAAWQRNKSHRNTMPLQWSKGLREASECTQPMLEKAGVVLMAKKATKQNVSSANSGGCGFEISRYSVRGFNGQDSRIQIHTGYSPTFNKIMGSLGFGNELGAKVDAGSFTTANADPSKKPRMSRWLPQGASGYTITIRDDDRVIEALCNRVYEHMNVSIAHLFEEGNEAAIEVTDGYVVQYDFIDQIYAPAFFGMPAWRTFDLLLADEVQDLSVLQGMMLRKLGKADSGAVLVGDIKQSIYGFTGASPDAMPLNREAFGATMMPMNTCFRSTHTLAREVRELMGADENGEPTIYINHQSPDWIESWPKGEPSLVVSPSIAEDMVEIGDMVECRLSAPLTEMAVETIKRGIPVVLAGGGSMEKNIRKMYLSTYLTEPARVITAIASKKANLLDKLTTKYSGDVGSAMADEAYTNFDDTESCIIALLDLHSDIDGTQFCIKKDSQGNQPADFLSDLFGADDEVSHAVVFTTVHRAKGLENGRMFIICDKHGVNEDGEPVINGCFMLPFACNTEAEKVQERNMVYVAISRAQTQNVYITNQEGAESIKDAMWMLDTQSPVDEDEDEEQDESDDEITPVIRTCCCGCGMRMVGVAGDDYDYEKHPICQDYDPNEVEPTPEPSEPTETAQDTPTGKYACVDANIEDDDVGDIINVILTDDLNEAKEWLIEIGGEESVKGYQPGIWVKGSCYCAIFLTEYDMPQNVVDAIAAHATPVEPVVRFEDVLKRTKDRAVIANRLNRREITDPPCDDCEHYTCISIRKIMDERFVEDEPVVDEPVVDEPVVDVIKATDIDAGDYIEIDGVDGEPQECLHIHCAYCHLDNCCTCEECYIEPEVEQPKTRTRKTIEDRIGDLEIATIVRQCDVEPSSIKDIADEMGCSVDTVKRVLSEMVAIEGAYLGGDEAWDALVWQPKTYLHTTCNDKTYIASEYNILVECTRSPTGRFARGSDITFTHTGDNWLSPATDDETPEDEVVDDDDTDEAPILDLDSLPKVKGNRFKDVVGHLIGQIGQGQGVQYGLEDVRDYPAGWMAGCQDLHENDELDIGNPTLKTMIQNIEAMDESEVLVKERDLTDGFVVKYVLLSLDEKHLLRICYTWDTFKEQYRRNIPIIFCIFRDRTQREQDEYNAHREYTRLNRLTIWQVFNEVDGNDERFEAFGDSFSRRVSINILPITFSTVYDGQDKRTYDWDHFGVNWSGIGTTATEDIQPFIDQLQEAKDLCVEANAAKVDIITAFMKENYHLFENSRYDLSWFTRLEEPVIDVISTGVEQCECGQWDEGDCPNCNDDSDDDDDTGITEDTDDDDGGDTPSDAESALESVFTGEELVSEDDDEHGVSIHDECSGCDDCLDPHATNEPQYDCGCINHGNDESELIVCESCGYVSCLYCHHINSQSTNSKEWRCYEGHGCDVEPQVISEEALQGALGLFKGEDMMVNFNPSIAIETGGLLATEAIHSICKVDNAHVALFFTDGYEKDSENVLSLTLDTKKVFNHAFSNKKGQMRKEFGEPVITFDKNSGHLVATTKNCERRTKVLGIAELNCEPPVVDKPIQRSITLPANVLKKQITALFKGGKKAGVLHSQITVWVLGTKVSKQYFVHGLRHLLIGKQSITIECRSTGAAEGSSGYAGQPLVIRGKGWTYMIAPRIDGDEETIRDRGASFHFNDYDTYTNHIDALDVGTPEWAGKTVYADTCSSWQSEDCDMWSDLNPGVKTQAGVHVDPDDSNQKLCEGCYHEVNRLHEEAASRASRAAEVKGEEE
jgi:hypothetical protein